MEVLEGFRNGPKTGRQLLSAGAQRLEWDPRGKSKARAGADGGRGLSWAALAPPQPSSGAKEEQEEGLEWS